VAEVKGKAYRSAERGLAREVQAACRLQASRAIEAESLFKREERPMDFDISPTQTLWLKRVVAFMDEHVYPAIPAYEAEMNVVGEARWKVVQVLEELKAKARAAGLWNFFMPPSSGHPQVDDTFQFEGPQLTNLEYSMIAEQLGKVAFASEVFNCSAPDTGNMEVLTRFGTRAQKERWLKPLMNGEIRSAFLMTEPAVASSDATNIETRIERDGDDYVINGRKWWSSGVGDPRCKVAIVMGQTNPDGERHGRQSQVLVPLDAAGVEVLRMLPVFGYDDAPHGHGEVLLKNVRVPIEDSLLLGEGRGFEIAQARLGPGRIHHCMRSIGAAEVALEKMCRRLLTRKAFGKAISEQSVWEERVAQARIDIEMCRLLCLKAADIMDKAGNKAARLEIAMIKVAAPNMALRIIDDAIQAHGGGGVTTDFGLASAYATQRTLRLADGPDEVHARTIARMEFGKYGDLAFQRKTEREAALAVPGIR
jgi:acyl-CoA dehydrogenase